jgi:hypothetical protein
MFSLVNPENKIAYPYFEKDSVDIAMNVPAVLRWMSLIYIIIGYTGCLLIDESILWLNSTSKK